MGPVMSFQQKEERMDIIMTEVLGTAVEVLEVPLAVELGQVGV